MLTIGSQQINDLYVGSQQIREAYVGQTLIYPAIDYTEPFYVENPDTSSHDVDLSIVSGTSDTIPMYYSYSPLHAQSGQVIDPNDFDGSGTISGASGENISLTIPAQSKIYLYFDAPNSSYQDYKLADSNTRSHALIDGIDSSLNIGGNIMSLLYGDAFTGEEDSAGSTSTYTFYRLFQGTSYIDDAKKLLLPLTTATNSCYYEMFDSSKLRIAPRKIDATTMSSRSCHYMFWNCTLLTTPPILPATILDEECYSYMFSRCSSLTIAPTLPATTLANRCYNSMFSNCTSLATAPTLPATTLASGCYNCMFESCTSLTKAPELSATTLTNDCYNNMFYGCTSLATAPELPATTLAESCYRGMFKGCTSLVTAPTLPVETLASSCYQSMFENCTSLTIAPKLPATTLVGSCYWGMFQGCTALKESPELKSTDIRDYSYYNMFYGCTSLNKITCNATSIGSYGTSYWTKNVSPTGTFYKNSNMNWASGASGIPDNWTVYDI